MRIVIAVVLTAAFSGLALYGAEKADDPLPGDEKILVDAGLKTDGASLVEFFLKRTLSPKEIEELRRTIRLLGHDVFAVREKASADLVSAGRSAIPFLRAALTDPDLEISRRARRCLLQVDGQQSVSLAMAAVRLLAKRDPPESVRVLIDYLPFADNDVIEEEVIQALLAISAKRKQLDESLRRALTDEVPIRRAVAALVVGKLGTVEDRAIIKKLLQDASVEVQLRAAQGLVEAKEKEAIPVLIRLLTTARLELAWQAEDLLIRVAGPQSPQVSLSDGKETARQSCRKAWEEWWANSGKSIDLANLDLENRLLGLTLVVVYDGYANGQGRIWEFGANRKPLWEIDRNLLGPIDAVVLPSKRILVAEYNGRRVTERDLTGEILWKFEVHGNPVACQRLENGNTFIATLNEVLEVTRAGTTVYRFRLNEVLGQVTYAQKLPSGNILCISSNGILAEFERTGKEVKRQKVGVNVTEWLSFELLPNGRLLVPSQQSNSIIEFGADGKPARAVAAKSPYSAVRRANGNLIVCSMNRSILYEVDRKGNLIWEETLKGRPFRVRRR